MRSSRGWLRAGLVVAVAVAAMLAPAAGASADPVTVTGGSSDWGVKMSFRNYITGPIAHGDIAVSGGATTNPDGTFHFPTVGGTYDPATRSGEIDLQGTVRFRGHETPVCSGTYLLFLTVTDPRLVLAGDVGTLYADATSTSLETGETVTYPNVDLASLDLTGVTPAAGDDSLTWTAIPALLTANGAPAFAGFYAAGTELDPVSFTISYADPATGPAGPQGPADQADPLDQPGPQDRQDQPARRPADQPACRNPRRDRGAGVPGPRGDQGPRGPKGDTGARGRDGRDAQVRCRVGDVRHRQQVICKVTYSGTSAARTRATLHRNGHVVARGTTSRLQAHHKLARGRYVLRLGTGHSAMTLRATVR